MGDKIVKIETYYANKGPFQKGIQMLRKLALSTELYETLKWGVPVYTFQNKNVLGIIAFSSYFGLWFYNGCFLKDPHKVLENAQEGKTKAMRHWKFRSVEEIDTEKVRAYIKEAIENQKQGRIHVVQKNRETVLPEILTQALNNNKELAEAYARFTPYKQGEFSEYLETARQLKTRETRLQKIIPMILEGVSLNDRYRSS
jgi:uncharacterized protein YdeI (YjbR/CyaY-like superfamily)